VDVMVERCAGLDVHRDNVVATARVPGTGRGRVDQQTRTFKSTLAGLAELAAWLAEAGVTLVGMEATGVYWKCAARRPVVFPAQPGGTRRKVLGSNHLPGSER
jgi:hypothetical protein